MRHAALFAVALMLVACTPPLAPPVPAGLDQLDAPVRAQHDERHAPVIAAPRYGDRWGALGTWFDAYEQWDPSH